jgi:mannosyltransferase OCH1-like enzyme
MGNAFDAFACGHEVHCYFLRAAIHHFRLPDTGVAMPNPWGAGWNRSIAETIPRRLFFYWDKNPPPEIEENFDHHQTLREITVDIYSQQRAEAFLYDYYGADTKAAFVNLRHPAEQSDFFRPHVVYAYGGYYLDADLRIASLKDFLKLASSSHQAMRSWSITGSSAPSRTAA